MSQLRPEQSLARGPVSGEEEELGHGACRSSLRVLPQGQQTPVPASRPAVSDILDEEDSSAPELCVKSPGTIEQRLSNLAFQPLPHLHPCPHSLSVRVEGCVSP